MNDRHTDDRHHHKHEAKEAVGAIFATREDAREALGALHKARFLKSWFGVTSLAMDDRGNEKLTAESATVNPFSGGSMGLVDALVRHGIDTGTAQTIESEIRPGEALVAVETEERDPAEAIAILERFGGHTELSQPRGSDAAQAQRMAAPGAPSGFGTPAGAPAAARDRSSAAPDEFADVSGGDVLELPVWEEEVFYVRGRG